MAGRKRPQRKRVASIDGPRGFGLAMWRSPAAAAIRGEPVMGSARGK